MAEKNDDAKRPIVIKKIKKGGGGHHGGAWKVAYADFVTAMMAFFLLMWLLNVTTKDQKEGIADFFNAQPIASNSESGAGGVLGGITVSKEGQRVSENQPLVPNERLPTEAVNPKNLTNAQLEAETKKREEKRFEEAKKQIEKAISDSDLKDLSKNLKIDMTSEGLRIQIVDQEGASMFPSGSAKPFAKTVELMSKVAQIVKTMPNQISVRGHTDGAPYSAGSDFTNWELSAERANASRRILLGNGIPDTKIANVIGKADTDHFIKANPMDAQNRRISIVLLRDGLAQEQGTVNTNDNAGKAAPAAPSAPAYRPTSGAVQFP